MADEDRTGMHGRGTAADAGPAGGELAAGRPARRRRRRRLARGPAARRLVHRRRRRSRWTARRSSSSARCRRWRASSPRATRAAPSAPPPRRAGSPGSARPPATSGSRSPARPSTATAARSRGARGVGDTEQLFTVASVPVMTRLRQPERVVLDTLVDAGRGPVALGRAGLGGRLVGQHADEWLAELRAAMAKVDDLRAKGPTATADAGPA